MALVRGNTSIRATVAAPGPNTLSHTVASGSGRILFVAVTLEDASNDVSAVSFNGDAMTLISGASVANGANKLRWYYLLDPDVTTGNISVTATGSTSGMCFAGINYTGWPSGGVPVVADTETASSTTSVTSSTITKSAGDFFLAAAAFAESSLTTTWTNATEWGDSQGNSITFSVAYYEGTNTSHTITAAPSSSSARLALSVIKLPEAAYSISVDDATIDPHPDTVVTITKNGGNWNGTVTATIEGTAITLSGSGNTTRTFTLDIDDLLPGGAWNAIRPVTDATLAVTDSDGTFTTEVQIVFDPSTAEDYVNSPGVNVGTYLAVPGAVTGDPHFAFWHLGDGVRDKTISGTTDAGTGYFAPITMPSQGRLIAYDVSGAVWLAHVDTAPFQAATLDISRSPYIPDAPASRQLLKWPNGFGNAVWTKTGVTVSSRFVSYEIDGETVWFDKIVETAANSDHVIEQRTIASVTSIGHSAQILVKANGRTDMFFTLYGNNTANGIYVRANLSTGALTVSDDFGTGTYAGSSIESKGNDVYLITVSGIPESATATSFYSLRIQLINSSTTYLGDGVSGVLLARSQLETGTTPTAYTHTEHVPLRSDQIIVRAQGPHNPVPYCNDLSNAAWTKTRSSIGSTITLNSNASNGWGGAVLSKIVEDSSTNTHYLESSTGTISANPAGLLSIKFLAQGDGLRNHVQLFAYADSGFSNSIFYVINLADGSTSLSGVGGTGGLHSISTALVDTVSGRPVYEITVRGWLSTTSAQAVHAIRFFLMSNGTTNNYTGNGTSGIYVGKIQVASGHDLPDYPGDTTAADPLFAANISEATLNGIDALLAGDNHFPQSRATNANGWGIGSNTTRVANGNLVDATYPGASSYIGNASGSNIFLSYNFSNLATGNWTVVCKARIVTGPKPTSGTILSCDYHNGSSVVRATVPISGSLLDGEWRQFSVTFNNQSAGSRSMYFGADTNSLCEIAFADVQIGPYAAVMDHTPTLNAAVHVLDRSSAIVTMPGIDEFDAAGDHVGTGWYRDQELAITDGSTTVTDTMQLEAYVPAYYGTIGGGMLLYPPAGAGAGDECYIRAVTGTISSAYPETCSVYGSGTAAVMAFDPDVSEWLAGEEVSLFGVPGGALGGNLIHGLRRLLHRRA